MSIDDTGWFDWALRYPGPPDKKYTQPNTVDCYLPHDMVGYLAGWYSRLFDLEKVDGRYTANGAASVHGSVLSVDDAHGEAIFIQHYSVWTSCWASGARAINTKGVAVEFERLRGDFPALTLTPGQLRTNVRIIRDLAALRRWPWVRRPSGPDDMTAQLYEHRECGRFGAAPTACNSGRVSWPATLALLEGDNVTDEQYKQLVANDGEILRQLGALGVKIDTANAFTFSVLEDLAVSDRLAAKQRLADVYRISGKRVPAKLL